MADPQDATEWFEDIPLNRSLDIGEVTFSEQAIIDYARLYDPHPRHCDPEWAAQHNPGGKVIAAPFHLNAIWMNLLIGVRKGLVNRAAGPSPGTRDMSWPHPTLAGSIVRYRATTKEKIDLGSMPEWGLLRSLNEAFDQDGNCVMRFTGQAFMKRKPD